LGKVSENTQVERGSQVVRVGDKHVFETILEQRVQAS
jgi:hypothetical protein